MSPIENNASSDPPNAHDAPGPRRQPRMYPYMPPVYYDPYLPYPVSYPPSYPNVYPYYPPPYHSQFHQTPPLVSQSYSPTYYPQQPQQPQQPQYTPSPSSGSSGSRPTRHPSKPPAPPPDPDDYDVSKTIVDGSTPMRNASAAPAPSPPKARVPPRKPKQSGHALWVGNLPSGTRIVDLKDHFARDASKDLESVFLISKSNCAFINYKSEPACRAALDRFHDSRFHGARLVCRLRRPGTAAAPSPAPASAPTTDSDGVDGGEGTTPDGVNGAGHGTPRPNRYFIVKSLTEEDIERSRRTGIWATQSHNESVLNHAYETSDNVYLVFSANKSGEYYGYARMMSPIPAEDAAAFRPEPTPASAPAPPERDHQLSVTATPASATAPNGRIIDDPARGTIFWEADTSEEEDEDEDGEREEQEDLVVVQNGSGEADDDGDNDDEPAESGFQSIGAPFRVQWCSTERVPFHRTRGLRNPWNANREVKIARDGTEIEPGVGERLIQVFHHHHVDRV